MATDPAEPTVDLTFVSWPARLACFIFVWMLRISLSYWTCFILYVVGMVLAWVAATALRRGDFTWVLTDGCAAVDCLIWTLMALHLRLMIDRDMRKREDCRGCN